MSRQTDRLPLPTPFDEAILAQGLRLLALTGAVAVALALWLSFRGGTVAAVASVTVVVVVIGCLVAGVLVVWELGRRTHLLGGDTDR